MQKHRIHYLAIALLLAFGALAGCSGSQKETNNVIQIATATPLSGSNSAIGVSIKNGAELALTERIDEFKELGYTLQLAPYNDEASPQVGVSNAQRIIENENILAVVGHYNSGVAIPSSNVYNSAGLAMISPGNTAVEVTDRNLPTVSRICGRDDCQGPAGADFLFNELGAKSVFIIQDKTAYGQGIANEFRTRYENLGGQVLGFEGITQGETDFSAVLEMVRASKAQAVYFGGIYSEGSLLIKGLAEKGISVVFLGPDGMDSADLVNIAGSTVIGTYYTSVAATSSNEKFIADYKAKYNLTPESWSGFGYDAMNVTLDAIRDLIKADPSKKPTREEVAAKIRATQNFTGIATGVSFNAIGDNTQASIYIFGFEEAVYPPKVVTSIPVTEYLND